MAHLPGGMGGVERVGDRVHRATGYWTPAVHALLAHLDDHVPHVPRVHGFDEQGREVLDFLPGEFCEPLSPAQITSLITWMRGMHEVVAGFVHPGPWRYFDIPDPVFIGHNDLAHYNACFDGDQLAGVFDWDLAGPTNPLMELAFAAWNIVPLWTDIGVERAAARLTHIAESYDGPSAHEILHAVPIRVQLVLDGIPRHAAADDQGMRHLIALGEPGRSAPNLADLITRIPLIDACL
jgi:phosphotransferase family enzyme